MVPVMNQILPCFHSAVGYFSVLLPALGLRNLGAIPGTQNSGAVGPGERGGSYAHTHIHSHTTRGHKAQPGTHAQHPPRSAHLQTSKSPIHLHQHHNTGARNLTHLARSRTHATHWRATHELAHARAQAHTPCTHPLARAQALAHRHTPARPRSRPVHTPSCARPRPRSPAHTRAHVP